MQTNTGCCGTAGVILPAAKGAYVLVVDLDAPLPLDIPFLRPAVLEPGRYAYCGSAYGPGGLKARIGRHLRREKAMRWHVDRLTRAGRVAALGFEPAGCECALVARLMEAAGAFSPVRGFGSSDCRLCPSHLVQVPAGFDPDTSSLFRVPISARAKLN